MDKVNMIKDWVMSRFSERTSWDGITIIAVSILVLCGVPIVKTKTGWKIKNTSGVSKSKKAAKRRLRAIKWAKKRRKRRRNT